MQQKAIIVLGMHRSGTSAMTRVLNLLGADLGSTLLEANPNNLKGFWEHSEILANHVLLLEELGSAWDDIRPLPQTWWMGNAARECQNRIIGIINTDFVRSKLWAVKDPRMCRLMKMWHLIFSETGITPHFIIVFRHPLEVVSSLKSAVASMGLEKSLLLWAICVLEAEKDTRHFRRVFISFNSLLQRPIEIINAISNSLEISWPQWNPESVKKINEFLDMRLRHHTCSNPLIDSHLNAPRWIFDLFEVLKSVDAKNGESAIDGFSDGWTEISQLANNIMVLALSQDIQQRYHEVKELYGWGSQDAKNLLERMGYCQEK